MSRTEDGSNWRLEECTLEEDHICLSDLPPEWVFSVAMMIAIILQMRIALGFTDDSNMPDVITTDMLLAYWENVLEPPTREAWEDAKKGGDTVNPDPTGDIEFARMLEEDDGGTVH